MPEMDGVSEMDGMPEMNEMPEADDAVETPLNEYPLNEYLLNEYIDEPLPGEHLSEELFLDEHLINEAPDETTAPLSDGKLEDVMSWEDPFGDDLLEEPSEYLLNEPSSAVETYAEPILGPLSGKPLSFE